MSRPEQLRRWAAARERRGLSTSLLRDSADEIERLREQVKRFEALRVLYVQASENPNNAGETMYDSACGEFADSLGELIQSDVFDCPHCGDGDALLYDEACAYCGRVAE